MLYKKIFFLCILAICLLSVMVEAKKVTEEPAPEESTDEPAADAEDVPRKKKSKSKGKTVTAAAIDSRDLEGVWETTFYYNHTESRVVARTCQKEEKIIWTISGSVWSQSHESDPLYNSNGKWVIKEMIQGDNINFVKLELLKDSITTIEPCIGYMRDGLKLFMMYNSTNPSTCPTKFQFFSDVCSNTVDYSVSECQSGKCTKSFQEVKEGTPVASSGASIYLVGVSFLIPLVPLFFL